MYSHLSDIPIIVLTGYQDESIAVDFVWTGAQDCISKDETGSNSLARSVRHAIEEHTLALELAKHAADFRGSEVPLRTVVAKNPDAIFVVDAQDRIAYANPAASVLIGRRVSDLVDSSCGVPVATYERTDVDIFRRDGVYVVAEMHAVNTQWEGKDLHLATLRDVTERKQIEARRNRRRKWKALVSWPEGVAHDFNNIVGGILGHAHLALDELPSDKP